MQRRPAKRWAAEQQPGHDSSFCRRCRRCCRRCLAAVGEWLEFKNGTYKAPIIVEAAAGATVNFNAYVSVRCARACWALGVCGWLG